MLSEKITLISYTLENLVHTQVDHQSTTDNTQGGSEDEPLPMETNSIEPPNQASNSHSQIIYVCPENGDHDPPPHVQAVHSHSDLPVTLTTPHRSTTTSSSHPREPTQQTEAPQGGYSTTRLPKLDIPVFTGEPLEWQSFWDCFEAAIDTNPSLTGVQKLSYLRTQLRGEATRAIAGFPLTNLNYHHSVLILKDRYGQPHKITRAHVQALLELPTPANKLTSLRLFHDTIESHVRCLNSVGKSPEALETLLVPMILTKLSEETKKNMARDHPSSEWTVEELQMAVLKEIRIFEIGQHTTTLPSQYQPIPTASFYTGINRRPGHTRREGSSKPSCAYCKGNHAANVCEVHKNISARLEVIKQK